MIFLLFHLGTGLYKTASFVNHSCDPNCVAIFDGTSVSLRTIKEVQAGEEFVISYVNLLAPTEIRQMELEEGYMFTCCCTVCKGEGSNDFCMKSIKCSKCSCFQSLKQYNGKFFLLYCFIIQAIF